jgi:hypothetical protein
MIMDWINLPWDMYQWRALVNTVMNFRIRSDVGGFSRRAQLREGSYF